MKIASMTDEICIAVNTNLLLILNHTTEIERAYFGTPQGTEFSIATQQGTRDPTDGQERNNSLEVSHHETQVRQP